MRRKIDLNLNLSLGWLGSGRVWGQVTVYGPPSMPGPLTIIPCSEENNMILFDVILPPPGAADVVSRELTITRDGADPVLTTVGKEETKVAGKAPQDSVLTLTLVDVDDAGNRSEPRVQTATVSDTFAPAQPGELGIVVTGEDDS